jgi:hypothetical protein
MGAASEVGYNPTAGRVGGDPTLPKSRLVTRAEEDVGWPSCVMPYRK